MSKEEIAKQTAKVAELSLQLVEMEDQMLQGQKENRAAEIIGKHKNIFSQEAFVLVDTDGKSPSTIALEVFQSRKSQMSAEICEKNKIIFTAAEDGLKRMKEKEVTFGVVGKDRHSFLPLIFLMNLVFGATRTFMYWTLLSLGNIFGLTEENTLNQMKREIPILMSLLQAFDVDLEVFIPATDSYFNSAFELAKKLFIKNCALWGKVVGKDLTKYLDEFCTNLKLAMFSVSKTSLWGLSSITGQYIFANVAVGVNMKFLVRILLHEMAHSFFRFIRLKDGGSSTHAVFMLSPVWNKNVQYNGFPIHSGTLYDYIFSNCSIEDENIISPFSLFLEEYQML